MDDNIIEGPPIPEELLSDPNTSPYGIIFESAKRFLNSIVSIDAVTGEQVKVQTIIDESEILASKLQSLGCKPGVFVGVLAENRREYASIVLAILKTGATIVCFNPLYSIGELEHTVNIVKPFLILTNSLAWKKLKNMSPQYKTFKYIIRLDERDNKPFSMDYKTIIENKENLRFVHPKIHGSDPAFILFSSGSTGLPKGVILSNESLVYLMKLTKLVKEMTSQPYEKRIMLSVIPSFHGYGVLVLLRNLISGETLISLKKFDEELFLSTIQRYKVKAISVVPAIMAFLAKHPLVDKYDLSSVNTIYCGAAPLSESLEETICKKFNLPAIIKGYGMTETTIICTSSMMSGDKLRTVGKIAFGMKAKIIDLETGEALGRNKEGEICLKGILVMRGYYNNPEETKKAIDEDGWLHTGDIGYFDDDDDLFIVDRIKDLIKYKGFQVAPAELEALLMRHSAVKDVAVVGIPDEVAGEVPRAFVVKKSPVNELELVDYVSRNVAPHMRLRGGVIFLKEIPRNANGKILRKNLKNWTPSKL